MQASWVVCCECRESWIRSESPKSLWTEPGKTLIYRPHEVAFCANADRDIGDGLQESGPDDRPVFWPDDDSSAAHGVGNRVSRDRSRLSNAAVRGICPGRFFRCRGIDGAECSVAHATIRRFLNVAYAHTYAFLSSRGDIAASGSTISSTINSSVSSAAWKYGE